MPARIHAAVQWAELILGVLESEFDPRTIDDWGRLVGAARSTLRHRCELVDVGVKASLDLARVLRAIVQATRAGCRPERLLDIKDPRTLQRLLNEGGLTPSSSPLQAVTALSFLAQQTFVRDTMCLSELERRLGIVKK